MAANTNKGFGLLFEMGCGKTRTAIAIAGAAYQKGAIQRVLVIAPTSVVSVWPKEIAEVADFKVTCKIYPGGPGHHADDPEDLPEDHKKAGAHLWSNQEGRPRTNHQTVPGGSRHSGHRRPDRHTRRRSYPDRSRHMRLLLEEFQLRNLRTEPLPHPQNRPKEHLHVHRSGDRRHRGRDDRKGPGQEGRHGKDSRR